MYLTYKRSARMHKFEELLPEAIDLMSRGLKAGHAVNSAIEMVSQETPEPVGTEFRRIFEEQNFGLPMREALINMAKRVPLEDVQFLMNPCRKAYEETAIMPQVSPHSRFDIIDWLPLDP